MCSDSQKFITHLVTLSDAVAARSVDRCVTLSVSPQGCLVKLVNGYYCSSSIHSQYYESIVLLTKAKYGSRSCTFRVCGCLWQPLPACGGRWVWGLGGRREAGGKDRPTLSSILDHRRWLTLCKVPAIIVGLVLVVCAGRRRYHLSFSLLGCCIINLPDDGAARTVAGHATTFRRWPVCSGTRKARGGLARAILFFVYETRFFEIRMVLWMVWTKYDFVIDVWVNRICLFAPLFTNSNCNPYITCLGGCAPSIIAYIQLRKW